MKTVTDGKGAVARLYCPINFHPDAMLAPEDRRLGNGMVYLCHAIMMRRVHDHRYRKGHHDGFVGLKAQYLQNVIGRYNWVDVRRLAISNSVVECDESYATDRGAKRYRLLSPYSETQWELREVADNGLRWRLQRWRKKRERAEWQRIESGQTLVAPEVCKFLYDQLQRCRIRKNAPLKRFAPEVAVAVDKIRRGDWFFHVDRYGRIHTNISNLKRELRSYLSVDGQRLVNVDIANSQPLFIGLVVLSHKTGAEKEAGGREGKQGRGREGASLYVRQAYVRQAYVRQTDTSVVNIENVDLRSYLEICERGELYEYVKRHLPGGLDYDTLKQRVLATLYDRDNHRNAVYRVLDKHFPTLMGFARHVKREDYRRLAHMAQRVESQFMYGQVVPRIMRERPGLFVATIHDSILVSRGAKEYVREVMLAEFRRLGVSPKVRIEE